ncbi:L-serine ammonia-lyase, iron-sulfur-dependent, subunit alpha [Elusimicrobiota bacterium]
MIKKQIMDNPDIDIQEIKKLLKTEIKEVVGCTEPAGIAFAFSKCAEVLKVNHDFIDINKIHAKLTLSHDVYRNASTVTVPILMQKGIKPAVSCGIYAAGNTLNVFSNVKIMKKKELIRLNNKRGWLKVVPLKRRGLFIRGELKYGMDKVQVMIEDKHDNIKRIILNKKVIYEKEDEQNFIIKNLQHIHEIVKIRDSDLEDIAKYFIVNHGRNKEKYCQTDTADSVDKLIKMRMEGENLKILTITGSGNQGIFLALPFYEIYKKDRNVLPAVLFSILTQIYLTQKKGRISGICGMVNKVAPSLIAGLSYYNNAKLEDIKKKMKSVREKLKILQCNGAKKSCSLKASLTLSRIMDI